MRIGIDLGGTKIEVIVLDVAGNVLFCKRAPTPSGQYQQTLDAIHSLIQAAEKQVQHQFTQVGVGTPGAINRKTGLIQNSNSVCLIHKPLQDDLEKILKKSVRLANDANCFALSEATDGAAQGADVVFGVILGTGVGGGIVVHGQVLTGANAIAGEWGHNALPWPVIEFQNSEYPGPNCYCGRSGCIETFLSGPAFEKDYERVSQKKLSAHEIVGAAESGETLALETIVRYEQRLAKALAGVVNILDPDVIVLGGGVSNIERLYQNVPQYWNDYIFSQSMATKLVQAKHGDSSGVRGAAWLWPEQSKKA